MLSATEDSGRSRAERRRDARMLVKGAKRKTHTGTTRNAWHSRYWPNELEGKR